MAFIDDLVDDLQDAGDIPTEAPDDRGKVVNGDQGDDELFGTEHGDLILGDRIPSDSLGGDDTIIARAGVDEVYGFGGDNVVDGGPGNDTLVTADGDDEIFGGTGNDDIQSGRGQDVIRGGPGNDALRGGEGDDLVLGETGNDQVIGGSDDDTVVGGLGVDLLEGRSGVDTFLWNDAAEGLDTIADFALATDRLQLDGVLRGFTGDEAELDAFVRFVPGATSTDSLLQVDPDGGMPRAGWQGLAVVRNQPGLDALPLYQVGDLRIDGFGSAEPFRALEYTASYHDLIQALGADPAAGKLHYLSHGYDEGRETSFDGLRYIASHGDLIETYGPDREAGSTHYIRFGHREGRPSDSFDGEQYLANYADLQVAFGNDTEAATVHYIQHGYFEGRSDEPIAPAALDFIV